MHVPLKLKSTSSTTEQSTGGKIDLESNQALRAVFCFLVLKKMSQKELQGNLKYVYLKEDRNLHVSILTL